MEAIGLAVLVAMILAPVAFMLFGLLMATLCKLVPEFEAWANAHLLEQD
jgi:hypothetical protein